MAETDLHANCTGKEATWCPVHGDCDCEVSEADSEARTLDDPNCPLHGFGSDHPRAAVNLHANCLQLDSPEAEKALAAVTHDECIADWKQRAAHGALAGTHHGVDAHIEAARRRLAALRQPPREGGAE